MLMMEILSELYQYLLYFIDIFLHLDTHLNTLCTSLGPWIYVILFLIIFCETGLVITPFLPGDSLLFALGALTTVENSVLSFPLLLVLLIVAGILGDAVNYSIGQKFGNKILKEKKLPLINEEHIKKTQLFYEQHGGKTIIYARFIPIIRTFAPFVAGIGKMSYSRFGVYNITGAILWVTIFLVLGHFFGNLPSIKSNFHYVIFGIIGVSFLPVVMEFIKSRKKSLKA
jgi:membrane-associated protein